MLQGEHSAILSTFIKLPFVINIFVLSFLDWLLKTCFTVCYFCLVLLCFRVRLFIDALWSPTEKGLASKLSFVMANCDVVTFPLVSWVRCGAYCIDS